MAGRQDGGTVLEGHADDLRAEVGGQTQFVAHGRGLHVAGRLLCSVGTRVRPSVLVERTDAEHRRVVGAVGATAVQVDVVACDAVEGRHGAGPHRRVTDGGDGRQIVDERAVAVVALTQDSTETAFAVAVGKARQVVPAHLIDHKTHDQPRLFQFGDVGACLRLGLRSSRQEAQEGDECPSQVSEVLVHGNDDF